MLKLDLGCGNKPKEGFQGVDLHDYGRSDLVVCDLREPWKWADESVDEVYSHHFVEHLTARERIHFANELFRVLKPGARAEIVVPHWSSGRAYGDLTHQWPPIAESWFWYLKREWRDTNAPHASFDYSCDFEVQWGTSLHADVGVRNHEFQQFASMFYREACLDLHSTWIKPEA